MWGFYRDPEQGWQALYSQEEQNTNEDMLTNTAAKAKLEEARRFLRDVYFAPIVTEQGVTSLAVCTMTIHRDDGMEQHMVTTKFAKEEGDYE